MPRMICASVPAGRAAGLAPAGWAAVALGEGACAAAVAVRNAAVNPAVRRFTLHLGAQNTLTRRAARNGIICHMSRDWWAVLIAALAAALVKLGLIAGVPW